MPIEAGYAECRLVSHFKVRLQVWSWPINHPIRPIDRTNVERAIEARTHSLAPMLVARYALTRHWKLPASCIAIGILGRTTSIKICRPDLGIGELRTPKITDALQQPALVHVHDEMIPGSNEPCTIYGHHFIDLPATVVFSAADVVLWTEKVIRRVRRQGRKSCAGNVVFREPRILRFSDTPKFSVGDGCICVAASGKADGNALLDVEDILVSNIVRRPPDFCRVAV